MAVGCRRLRLAVGRTRLLPSVTRWRLPIGLLRWWLWMTTVPGRPRRLLRVPSGAAIAPLATSHTKELARGMRWLRSGDGQQDGGGKEEVGVSHCLAPTDRPRLRSRALARVISGKRNGSSSPDQQTTTSLRPPPFSPLVVARACRLEAPSSPCPACGTLDACAIDVRQKGPLVSVTTHSASAPSSLTHSSAALRPGR